MIRRAVLPAIGFLLAIGACGKREEPPAIAPAAVRGVRVETLAPRRVGETYEAVGTVRSRITSVLSSKVVGNVVSVRVVEGDSVQPGKLLVEIDARETESLVEKGRAGLREAEAGLEEAIRGFRATEQAVTAAEANRHLAAATYGRFQELAERRSVSRQELDEVEARYKGATAEAARAADLREAAAARRMQAQARIDQAKADLATAQVSVGHSRIVSPIAGVVTARAAEAGMMAAPGVPLVTVEERRYRLEAVVEESKAGTIRQGQRVRVQVDALGGRDLEGRVVELAPAGDPATRSYVVKIELPPEGKLRSGLFGRASFRAGERQILAVPRKAIVERGQLKGVYALDGANVAHLRLITTGKEEGGRAEVLSGLDAGERIVVEGVERVTDGSRVEQP